MRGASLRLKINAAILLAFLAAALAFGAVLRLYLADRTASAHNRTRTLLAAIAVHRLEALVPLVEAGGDPAAARDILTRLTQVEGVTGAALFDANGGLLAHAGPDAPAPLIGALGIKPTSRVFAVSVENNRLAATLIEPLPGQAGPLGFLRLRYNLQSMEHANQRLWSIFLLALLSSYVLMAGLLNLLLHRFVLRPVDILRQALEAVECGRLDAAVPVVSRDALGRLATAFNAMTARLRETSDCLGLSRAEVEEQRRLLESRVATRTAELAAVNDRLVDEIGGRRQAEESLRQALAQRDALLGNSRIGLATVRDHRCLDINPRGAEVLGYTQEELLDQTTRLLFADDDAFQRTTQEYEQALAERGAVSFERQLRRRDGSLVWVRAHGKLVAGMAPSGDVVWAFDDISEEKKRQTWLEQARLEAEKASRAKGAFLAVMSHEIRTPLNAIMGLTELLLTRDASAEQRAHLRTIEDSARHLNGIINDILDFSKIEAGKLVLERVDFHLGDLLDAVTRVMEIQARQKGLRFEVALGPGTPEVLRGDPGRLRQVLLNLLGNAVKFTEKGAVSLTVDRIDPTDCPEGRIGLSARIIDSGIGIDQDRMSGLFNSFQQGSGSIARRFGGTGLGLAISKEIVDRMGGAITVRSTKGLGSVFTCSVFMEPGDPALAAGTRESDRPGTPAAPGSRLRILLVEDNALNAAVTRLHLGRMGHDLTVATSAREAYEQLARTRFDTVLMDIEMPDIDGITATRTIRSGGPATAPTLDPDVPIVAVTAHAVEDVRQLCLDAGMHGFVTKPVNYRTLETILRQISHHETPLAESETAPAATTTSNASLFDPETAREAMGISWDQYGALSRVSFAEGSKRLAEARQALDGDDFSRAGLAAHTFKGIAATLGGYSCRELAVRLEQASRNGETATARDVLDRIAADWEAVGRALAQWRAPDAQEPA